MAFYERENSGFISMWKSLNYINNKFSFEENKADFFFHLLTNKVEL